MSWLKRNWKWIVFPIGIILLLLHFFGARKRTAVVSPPTNIERPLREIDQSRQDQVDDLNRETEASRESEEHRHEEAIENIEGQATDLFEELKKKDPQGVTDWLLGILKRKP